MQLTRVFIHPVKSCASLERNALDVEGRGPRFDRRWMVVDADGRFVTGRKLPRMVLIRAEPTERGVILSAPGMPVLPVDEPQSSAPRMEVVVWGNSVAALAADARADDWLCTFLGTPVRLVHMDEAARRSVDPDHARQGDEVSFADGYPLLLIGQASLDHLNGQLSVPLPITRFRPNLVIGGAVAHAEDDWRRIRIGAIELELVKPCTRCVFTTVDPESGTFDPAGQPLATLKTYRRSNRGITFGMNAIARGNGPLRVGDAVQVLERRGAGSRE
ncbi:MAG TPA: MOSC domain-containing protein [Xanthomonadaceae bacterium]|nr:MOSC domain-containing protein [Xanthomonadaceae bacterium]